MAIEVSETTVVFDVTVNENVSPITVTVNNRNLEENIVGSTSENLTMSGAVNIDLSTFSAYRITLTGNTTITFTNTPASGYSVVKTFLIDSDSSETLGFSNSDNEYGSYVSGGTINKVVVEAANYTSGLQIDVQFSQAN